MSKRSVAEEEEEERCSLVAVGGINRDLEAVREVCLEVEDWFWLTFRSEDGLLDVSLVFRIQFVELEVDGSGEIMSSTITSRVDRLSASIITISGYQQVYSLVGTNMLDYSIVTFE